MQTKAERRGSVAGAVLLAALAWLSCPARTLAPPPPAPPLARTVPGDPRLDLNRAGIAELDTLPGIGPVLARRIVAHRETHGVFESLEELRAIRGIGARLFARIRNSVRIGAPLAGGTAALDSAGAPAAAGRPARGVRP